MIRASALRVLSTIALGCALATGCSEGDPAAPSWPTIAPATGQGGSLEAAADAGSPCPGDVPQSCPADAAPSWSGAVDGIVQSSCNPCHAPGGAGDSLFDDTSYQNVHNAAGGILTFVGVYCEMPPPDAAALTPADREALLTWVTCGSPDN